MYLIFEKCLVPWHWLWMDRFLLFHALSLAIAFVTTFSHGATFGSREMMAPK